MFDLDDTIVAIASAAGGAARGVVRLSGDAVAACLNRCLAAEGGRIAAATSAVAMPVAIRLDERRLGATLYYWPNGRSYTGQPAAEIHTLGSWPVLEAIVAACCAAGARVARPGEFTLRAVMAGKLDLAQAEAVLGVIEAEGEAELDAALDQLAGGLSRPMRRVRQELLTLLADIEAGLDFPDEDITFVGADEASRQLAAADEALAAMAGRLGERLGRRPLPRAVLTGAANAGKSSLFNAIVGRSAAIVSHLPGTTRDWLVAEIDAGGVRFELVDTPGQHGADDGGVGLPAERAVDVLRARCAVEVACATAWPAPPPADRVLFRLSVQTKADLSPGACPPGVLATSAHSGEGIEDLRRAIAAAVGRRPQTPASVHCREAIAAARTSVAAALELARGRSVDERLAAELRVAAEAIGRVTGQVFTEELLDVVFSRFCIGK